MNDDSRGAEPQASEKKLSLGETLEGHLSERVFSYRRGRSALGAVEQLLCYLRAHKRACPERRQQGLYVLRRDVRGYGEAIASGPASRLWPLVQAAAAASGEQLGDLGSIEQTRSQQPAFALKNGARRFEGVGALRRRKQREPSRSSFQGLRGPQRAKRRRARLNESVDLPRACRRLARRRR